MITKITILNENMFRARKNNKELTIILSKSDMTSTLTFKGKKCSITKFINKYTETYKILQDIIKDFDYYCRRAS